MNTIGALRFSRFSWTRTSGKTCRPSATDEGPPRVQSIAHTRRNGCARKQASCAGPHCASRPWWPRRSHSGLQRCARRRRRTMLDHDAPPHQPGTVGGSHPAELLYGLCAVAASTWITHCVKAAHADARAHNRPLNPRVIAPIIHVAPDVSEARYRPGNPPPAGSRPPGILLGECARSAPR